MCIAGSHAFHKAALIVVHASLFRFLDLMYIAHSCLDVVDLRVAGQVIGAKLTRNFDGEARFTTLSASAKTCGIA
jgi:hypothetical protein